ncbi:MFS transporter [Frankia sp. AgB1.9]|uniref:MFS transporter n=1 Tax=unclassified Frankia TaxID=2632575 RepID=UPI0019320492|nr:MULTISPECIES: MFS transporter [unclassified Frankia]MBL7488923.1 MFS transporter [Frankia sp. AgW1.1]MBL7546730.1 MFS transporter [Frankia sp. AgB1.9]MBL7621824.1 MFS transporter [Frankia sp. AgB1.8]
MSNQTSLPAPTSEATVRATAWAPLAALASGTTVLVTSEFLPAGVLPTMAADIGVSEGVAGLAVAATAIAGAFTAPTIALLLPRTDRRSVLIALLVAGVVANLAVTVAPNFAVLLLGRLLLGIAIAGFWSFAFGAGLTAMPGRPSTVSTALAFGVSLATVLGVPLAAFVGNDVGWRAAFAGAAAVCAAAAAWLAVSLPGVPAHPSAGLPMLRAALARRRLMAGIGCVALAAFGNFASYPYIRVAIERVSADTTWLLVAWGVGGMAGNFLAGALAARLRQLAAGAPILLAAGLLVTATAHSVVPLAAGIVLWGFAFNMLPVATQLWVTRVEPDRAEAAVSLQVTAFQVAITLGASVGGALLDAHGVRVPLVVGAASALAAGLGFGLLRVPRG